MPETYFPLIANGGGPVRRIAIDPLTRIEGHLRIEATLQSNAITDAWSSSTMFRGIETILAGRDPREAWVFAQRICGVCTHVHALASIRAVENALGISIPENARIIRNLLEAAQFIQDHVVHFYHLHALDWVDVTSALLADPAATSSLQRALSNWPNNSQAYFAAVQARLQALVDSGQLGLFANGYWGHPAYKLPPEVNLLAVAHYLEALDFQRDFIKMHAILGGKNPHPQTYLVGGIAIPVNRTGSVGVNPATISQLRNLANQALDFVSKVYLPDLNAIAGYYQDWAALGAGPGNYLSYGDFPLDGSGSLASLWMPRGIVLANNLSTAPQSLDPAQITEYVTHAWYSYTAGDGTGLHPSQGETNPDYTGPTPPFDWLDTDNKYSWLKTPRYNGLPMEVGPLARVVVAYASGHARLRQLVDQALSAQGMPTQALFSTWGRILARGIETLAIAEQVPAWIDELDARMNADDTAIHNGALWDPADWPATASGWGSTEAPRGGLGHWVRIANGQVERYQAVVPTTWNGSPRDAEGQRGSFEQSLIGTHLQDPERPLENLRTIHSFDPCMACSVHLVEANGSDSGITVRVG